MFDLGVDGFFNFQLEAGGSRGENFKPKGATIFKTSQVLGDASGE